MLDAGRAMTNPIDVLVIEPSESDARRTLAAIRRKAPGESLSFQVLRDSAIRVMEVTAGDRDVFYR